MIEFEQVCQPLCCGTSDKRKKKTRTGGDVGRKVISVIAVPNGFKNGPKEVQL